MPAPAPQSAPAWANELALAYESGASSQFILFGNVHDKVAVGDKLVNLADYLKARCSRADVVLSYDLGMACCSNAAAPYRKVAGRRTRNRMREPQRAISGSEATCATLKHPHARQQGTRAERCGDRARR
jgi:hypothetical protein